MNNADPAQEFTAIDTYEPHQHPKASSGLAWGTISLIVGLMSLLLFTGVPFFGLLPCAVAIFCGHKAISNNIKGSGKTNASGIGVSIAGLVLGYVSLILCLIWSGIIWFWNRVTENGMEDYYSTLL